MTNIPKDVMKTARELIQERRVRGNGNTYQVICPTPTRIARALMTARNTALEEAAQAIHQFHWTIPVYESAELNHATDEAACLVQLQLEDAIRAMKGSV